MEGRRTRERPPGETGAPDASGRDGARETGRKKVAVSISGVTKSFGESVAVDDLTLDIYEGEFFSLLGPSGCGKTTTLRMIAGFEEPSEGGISVAGEPVGGVPPYKRPVNTVFQSYAVFPHLNVAENVAFGLKRAGVKGEELNRRVAEACGMVQLGGFEKRKPSQLSGGQQQRVALARALVNRPKVLLLDEPLGALDLKLRKELQLELRNLQHEVGITFVYVTHDQEEALTMSDRIAVMNGGKVQQVADPATLYELPKNRFVAGFIGQTNVFSGTVEAVEGEKVTLRTPGGLAVEAAAKATAREGVSPPAVGDRAHAAVRPEKVRFGDDGENAFSAEVRQTVYVGASTQYITGLDDGETLVLYRQNARGAGPPTKTTGDDGRVPVAFDAHDCLVLED